MDNECIPSLLQSEAEFRGVYQRYTALKPRSTSLRWLSVCVLQCRPVSCEPAWRQALKLPTQAHSRCSLHIIRQATVICAATVQKLAASAHNPHLGLLLCFKYENKGLIASYPMTKFQRILIILNTPYHTSIFPYSFQTGVRTYRFHESFPAEISYRPIGPEVVHPRVRSSEHFVDFVDRVGSSPLNLTHALPILYRPAALRTVGLHGKLDWENLSYFQDRGQSPALSLFLHSPFPPLLCSPLLSHLSC